MIDFMDNEESLVGLDRKEKLSTIQNNFENLYRIIGEYKETIPKDGIPDYRETYKDDLEALNNIFKKLCDNKLFKMSSMQKNFQEPQISVEAGISRDILIEWMLHLTHAIHPKV